MRASRFLGPLIAGILGVPDLVGASPGDDLYIFDDCLFQCEQITCHNNHYYIHHHVEFHNDNEENHGNHDLPYHPEWSFDREPLPAYMKLMGWDCGLNCDYQCQRIITKDRLNNNEEVLQFHGKWPFLRIFGIQELASVIFSVGNFIPHFIGARKIIQAMKLELSWTNSFQYINTLAMAIITMGAWTASLVFHVRDTELTEKIDYFLAGLTVLAGFHGIAQRVGNLYLPVNRIQSLALTAICVLVYTLHVYRLVTDWLYTYNMQANVAVALLQNACWCTLCFRLYSHFYELESSVDESLTKLQRHHHLNYIDPHRIILPSFYAASPKLYSLYPLLLSSIVVVGMALEIFDFPPFFFDLIDAHALWHLVTIIPATYGLYDWIIWDTKENVISELDQLNEIKER